MPVVRRVVLCCGGRSYDDVRTVELALQTHLRPNDVVVHGGSSGADWLAGHVAARMGHEVRVYHAEWSVFGRRAGPIRNQLMLDREKPSLVLAFPGGRGTNDMISRANLACIPIERITPPR